ncbi:ribosome-binding protein 1 [Babesia caballi]|uniref:Ribosome-binding protein 1 n=1 Tax=Babesia caballi TaxID=5871 RepID=A0AAV4LRX9_BABCB|nr:ribosome-binding protein 1 [Babesia caballi]
MPRCPNVPAPRSSKGALDLFGALNHNSGNLKDSVGKKLEERVAKALGLSAAPMSVACDNGSTTIKDNFEDVLSELDALRKEIVDASHHGSYGDYEFLKDFGVNDYCAKTCVSHILDILPSLYATLNFLYFHVDSLQNNLGGGGWENQSCNTGSMSQWFKYSHGIPSASHSGSMPSDASPTILPGGYGNNLSAKQGRDLDTPLGELLSGSGSDDGGYLHNLLLDVAIITPWSPCNTATCVAAVRGLCEKLDAEFRNHLSQYADLAPAFKSASSQITRLAPDVNSESNVLLTALFKGSPVAYSKRVDAKAFKGYMNWLNRDLNSLIASLTALSRDCENWSQQAFKTVKFQAPSAMVSLLVRSGGIVGKIAIEIKSPAMLKH